MAHKTSQGPCWSLTPYNLSHQLYNPSVHPKGKGKKDKKKPYLYPKHFKGWNFGCAKAPKFDDRKLPNINNMGQLTIVELRKLSRCPNANFGSVLDITKLPVIPTHSTDGLKIIGVSYPIHPPREVASLPNIFKETVGQLKDTSDHPPIYKGKELA